MPLFMDCRNTMVGLRWRPPLQAGVLHEDEPLASTRTAWTNTVELAGIWAIPTTW